MNTSRNLVTFAGWTVELWSMSWTPQLTVISGFPQTDWMGWYFSELFSPFSMYLVHAASRISPRSTSFHISWLASIISRFFMATCFKDKFRSDSIAVNMEKPASSILLFGPNVRMSSTSKQMLGNFASVLEDPGPKYQSLYTTVIIFQGSFHSFFTFVWWYPRNWRGSANHVATY